MFLGFAVALALLQTVPSHTAGVVDTVRYNRDEFGLKIHVPTEWKGRPSILFPDSKGGVRQAKMEALDSTSFRGRLKAGKDFQYAFWLGPAKFKAGVSGSMLDSTGVHETATPSWFSQSAADYAEVKPPIWPEIGAVIYGLDTDRFGDKTIDEAGALSVEKRLSYIQGLGVNTVWLTAIHKDSDDAVETLRHVDLHVIGQSPTFLKGLDGIADGDPPATKAWRIAIANRDLNAVIAAGHADTALDERWQGLVYRFVRDTEALPSSFDSGFRHLREDYPNASAGQLVLRLGGPNRPRPTGLLKGDRTRLSQAWLLLFSLPGVPMFDAGDEIGLFDADARMAWDPPRQDAPTLDMVKQLVQLRTSRPSLFRGSFATLITDDDAHTYAFERDDRFEITIAVFNNSDKQQEIRIPSAPLGSANVRTLFGTPSLSSFGGSLVVTLQPHGCALLGS